VAFHHLIEEGPGPYYTLVIRERETTSDYNQKSQEWDEVDVIKQEIPDDDDDFQLYDTQLSTYVS
jgi:hypothetical protein